MNLSEDVSSYLTCLPDDKLRAVLMDCKKLEDGEVLPATCSYITIARWICSTLQIKYSLRVADSFIMSELSRRFIETDYSLLITVSKDFVDKVDQGKARSTKSYAAFKEALSKLKVK